MNIFGKIINLKALPYNLSNDSLYLKLSILELNGNPSYLNNISLTLHINTPGIDTILGMYTSNEFGVIDIIHNTNPITPKTIDTALVWITFDYDGTTYQSNKARVNFIFDELDGFDFVIIDASNPTDRLNNPTDYNLYDAGIRHATPSDPALSNPTGDLDRTHNPTLVDYTIVNRDKDL